MIYPRRHTTPEEYFAMPPLPWRVRILQDVPSSWVRLVTEYSRTEEWTAPRLPLRFYKHHQVDGQWVILMVYQAKPDHVPAFIRRPIIRVKMGRAVI